MSAITGLFKALKSLEASSVAVKNLLMVTNIATYDLQRVSQDALKDLHREAWETESLY